MGCSTVCLVLVDGGLGFLLRSGGLEAALSERTGLSCRGSGVGEHGFQMLVCSKIEVPSGRLCLNENQGETTRSGFASSLLNRDYHDAQLELDSPFPRQQPNEGRRGMSH